MCAGELNQNGMQKKRKIETNLDQDGELTAASGHKKIKPVHIEFSASARKGTESEKHVEVKTILDVGTENTPDVGVQLTSLLQWLTPLIFPRLFSCLPAK